MTRRFVIRGLVVLAATTYSVLSAGTASAQFALIRTVNTTADTIAPNACATGNPCSLRAAMTGITADIEIRFQISASDPLCISGVCTININSSLPPVVGSNISITGPGASQLVVKPATGIITNVFVLSSGSGQTVRISGLTVRDGTGFGNFAGGITKGGGGLLEISD